VPALALGLVAALPLSGAGGPGGSTAGAASAEAWTPMTPVSVTYRGSSRVQPLNVLSFNDFHGAIDPPSGSGGLVNGVPAGGAEYLATTLRELRAEARRQREPSLTLAAGDLIGATPLVSAAFHDEPAIEALSLAGLDISSVGNHEFDEGTAELLRIQNGGCHPVDGCQDGDGFAGARFRYLAANVVDKKTREPLLPAYAIRTIGGVRVGVIGLTLKGTPSIVNPAGISTVDFLDEATTANYWAARLQRERGINAFALLIHQGGFQNVPPATPPAPPTPPSPNGCAGFAGPITPIVAGLREEFGLVISGHTHRYYTCELPNSSGAQAKGSVVTSAGSNGVLVTDIDASLDRRTGYWAAISARNVIVENGVRNPDGTWQTDAAGNYVRNPARVDRRMKALADKYRRAVAPIANRVVGRITADITTEATPAGESALGDVIADAQLAYTAGAGAQIALMNPGGIRAPLTYGQSSGGEAPGEVTYGEAFTVQPFNNLLVTQTFTGAQLKAVLEQQFVGFQGQTSQRILQVSAGFAYRYDPAAPVGQKVSEMTLGGVAVDPETTYRVTTNDFLANGGDGFTTLSAGTARATAPGFDVDALTAYLGGPASPVAPGPRNRITVG